jgi:hypothetical protein
MKKLILISALLLVASNGWTEKESHDIDSNDATVKVKRGTSTCTQDLGMKANNISL